MAASPIANMTPEIEEVFSKLRTDLIWLHIYWKLYKQLYVSGQDRIDLMNRGRSGFFQVVHASLRDNLFLGLGRMTDPSRTGKNKNLCAPRLAQLVARQGHPSLLQSLPSILDSIIAKSKSFRDWRNRRLAHSDLATALRTHPSPLPGITRDEIEGILADLRQFLNAIQGCYMDANTEYEIVFVQGDGEDILDDLRKADAYEAGERAALEKELGRKLDD